MSRRANGDGTVHRRQDGRWEAACYVTALSGQRVRKRVYGKTRSEATARLIQLQGASARGEQVSTSNRRLGEYLDYWLENVVRTTRRYATYQRALSTVRTHLQPGLGQRRLDRISLTELQQFFNKQLASGHSVRSVHLQRITLSTALKRAMREELVSRNVAALVELPTDHAKERMPWDMSEVAKFLQAAEGHELRPAFVLVSTYGLRRGEVLGLRTSDVDLTVGVIRVRQQIQVGPAGLEPAPLKTAAGARDLPLLPHVKAALEATLSGRTDGLVFTTSSGKPIDPSNLSRSFNDVLRVSGLRRQTLHGLRHAVATSLKDSGAPARDIQMILGHADVRTTMQIYQHTNLDAKRRALEGVHSAPATVSDGSRCRQSLPSGLILQTLIHNFNSGGPGGIRTHDTWIKSSICDFLDKSLTTVLLEQHVAQRQQRIGRVAVFTAVKDSNADH